MVNLSLDDLMKSQPKRMVAALLGMIRTTAAKANGLLAKDNGTREAAAEIAGSLRSLGSAIITAAAEIESRAEKAEKRAKRKAGDEPKPEEPKGDDQASDEEASDQVPS